MIRCIVFLACINMALGQLCTGSGLYSSNFDKCYHVFTVPQTYEQSSQICASIGGRLVSIHNAFEQSLVIGTVLKVSNKNDYWIGLNDFRQYGVWEWADGVNSSYVDWASGFPSGNSTWRCVASIIRNGLWYNSDCAMPNSFVCEVEPNHGSDGQSEYCGGDGLKFGKCYFYMNSPQSHSSAKQICTDLGASLVTVETDTEESYLQREVRTHQMIVDYWIGLEDLFDYGIWQWDDNSSLVYSNWMDGFPLNGISMDCAAASVDNGKWYNGFCEDNEFNFVCQTKPFVNSTIVTTTTAIVPPSTPSLSDEWVYYNVTGFWYKAISYNTWDLLEKLCQVEGAHLASIHSRKENDFVRSLHQRTQFIFLGLQSPEDGDFNVYWTDGTKLDYTYWQMYAPSGLDNCVTMINTGEWTNLGCWLYYWGVCKK